MDADINAIDRYVGERLAAVRNARGIRAGVFGASCNITIAQLHDYEAGRKRISAAQLWAFAHVLQVPVSEFYAGLNGAAEPSPADGHFLLWPPPAMQTTMPDYCSSAEPCPPLSLHRGGRPSPPRA